LEHGLVQRCDELVFEALARDQNLVVAGAAQRVQAAVVAASLPAHESDRAAAGAALERAGKQVHGVGIDVALALAFEPFLLPLAREDAIDLAPARLRGVPFLVRDDADVGALLDDPFLFRAGLRFKRRPSALARFSTAHRA
jgi:hypothetical protein